MQHGGRTVEITPKGKKLDGDFYAIVRHSAFGYNGDPTFRQGLEQRAITTQDQLLRVVRLGGVAFPSYGKAEDYCMWEQYRNTSGMVPRAPGSFSWAKLDGLQLYIPVEPVRGADWVRPTDEARPEQREVTVEPAPGDQPRVTNPDLWR